MLISKEPLLRAFRLSLDVGKAVLVLAAVVTLLVGISVVWLEGAALTVVNQSGRPLTGVRLLAGNQRSGIDEIWWKDLASDETKWSYTFSGKDRAVVQYTIDGTPFEVECLYDSAGLGVSAVMTIRPDRSLDCESWLRI